jgi:hypothetical protein
MRVINAIDEAYSRHSFGSLMILDLYPGTRIRYKGGKGDVRHLPYFDPIVLVPFLLI